MPLLGVAHPLDDAGKPEPNVGQDDAPDHAEDAGLDGFGGPCGGATEVFDVGDAVLDDVREHGEAEGMEGGDDDVSADPEHSDRADDSDDGEDLRHDGNEASSKAGNATLLFCEA